MFTLFNGLFVSIFLFGFVFYNFFKLLTRFSILKSSTIDGLTNIVNSNTSKILLVFLFIFLLLVNLIGNIPLNSIPTIFYRVTFTIRFTF